MVVRLTEQLERQIALAAAQSANDGIVCIDSRGRITFWNRGAEEAFGYTADEVLGQSLAVVMPQRFRAAHAEGLRRVAKDHQTRLVGRTVELAAIRRDGTEFPVELSLAAWTSEGETFFTGVIRDITERKHTEQVLAEAREALEVAYKREHRIADTLQRALIPDVRVSLTGYEVVARYQPALLEAEVGGDFYDVFTLNDGRIAMAMGDVSGKGLQAAVHTAMAKYMLRAYAYDDPDPCHVLTRLNEAMCCSTPDDLFVTVFYGVLDQTQHTFVYGSAGHDGPLVYSPSASGVIPLDSTGCVCGMFPGAHYGHGSLKLSGGDVLLIYTDGITEARSSGRLFGADGLAEVLAISARGDHRDITDAVFEAAIAFGGGALRDDAAVLVLKALDEAIIGNRE